MFDFGGEVSSSFGEPSVSGYITPIILGEATVFLTLCNALYGLFCFKLSSALYFNLKIDLQHGMFL